MKIKTACILLIFSVSALAGETQPCLFHFVSIAYPRLALLGQLQGDVVVAIEIDNDGKIHRASATTGHPVLKRAAEDNIRRWRFGPGEERTLTVTYRFTLKNPPIKNPTTEWTVDFPRSVHVTSNRQAPLG